MHPKKLEIINQAIQCGNFDVDDILMQAKEAGVPMQEGHRWVGDTLRRFSEELAKSQRSDIYVDGSFESGVMGIGVVSTELGIEISELCNGSGTNNVAECLAVIRACMECKARNIKGVNIRSDSALVVNWTNGRYAQRSATAQKFVPQILALLKEIDGHIYWTPGKTNPADRYSRRGQCVEKRTFSSPLEKVIHTPASELRFQDFACLKSGRDEYSRSRLPKLRELVSAEDFNLAFEEFDGEGSQHVASCLRWVLRGLTVEKAIRKVRVSIEIGEKAKSARKSLDD